MADTTVTSANSVFTLTATSLFPVPQQLQGYSADRAFTAEAITLGEVNMGVDGRMTAGFTPNPVVMSITLQADSPSRSIFMAIIEGTKTAREIFWLSAEIALPSTGEKFTCVRGILTRGQQIPPAAKLLQPLEFEITWERIDRSLL